MKIPSTFTKLFVTGLFVLGLALPATAAQGPQPFDNVDSQYADWGDEYGDRRTSSTTTSFHRTLSTRRMWNFSRMPLRNNPSDLKYHNDLDMKDKAMSNQQSGSHWMIDEDW